MFCLNWLIPNWLKNWLIPILRAGRKWFTGSKLEKRIVIKATEIKLKSHEWNIKEISRSVVKHIYTKRKCVYDEMKSKLFSIKEECNFTV